MENRNVKKRWNLTISLVLFVFGIMISTMLLAGLLVMILHLAGVMPEGVEVRPEQMRHFAPLRFILSMFMFSAFLGAPIAWFFSKKALRPIKKVVDATRQVAEGNYDVQVDIKGINELEELSHSFNKMTQELSSVESLRRDFINNFSHEFKTPIVSIRGFAKLLKEGSLNDEDKQEYLDIIITESERLAALSTNVLNLSKFETLETIADKSPFRVDEQIRRAVLVTEPKWTAKNLDVEVDMDEITYHGNADITQQIWLNLIDNAVKYSNSDGSIIIRLKLSEDGFFFAIKDSGIGMDEQTKVRIFDKFYQGDASRIKSGNGLGLTIVKRIVDLCGGRIEVKSELGVGSEFVVWLPIIVTGKL